MCVLASVLIIIVAVVAAGGHRAVGDVEYRLQFVGHSQRVVGGLRYADAPWGAVGIDASGDHFAAYFYHEILDVVLLQQTHDDVCAVAFGNG